MKTQLEINTEIQGNVKSLSDNMIEVKGDIKTIKENHLAHIQDSMGSLSVDVGSIATDMSWLKKFFWLVATAAVGGLATAIFSVIQLVSNK